ncbi:hypothetical protein [Peptoniphilus porci]|uniref:Uncharacterized protein n=1 Tax=Peptoniphilus porci TaxID=2652280 RepID=A0A1U7LXV0_9FIRM|nr:hypothetical protein [Peptoniphilus porci]OLR64250.1 hypothetical protein BIV18_01155 [Peptoniphilus porci]
MKKSFSILIVACILFNLVTFVSAQENENNEINNEENGIYYEQPRESIEKFFNDARKETEEKVRLLNSITTFDNYSYEYKTEYSSRERVYANNVLLNGQPRGGTRIDGYININTDKGTPIKLSVSVGLPKVPTVMINVEMGSYTGTNVSGYSIRVPNSYQYFLAYADKTFEVEGHVVYYRLRNSNDEWKVYTTFFPHTLFNEHFYVMPV